jgi:hypothetical protein
VERQADLAQRGVLEQQLAYRQGDWLTLWQGSSPAEAWLGPF